MLAKCKMSYYKSHELDYRVFQTAYLKNILYIIAIEMSGLSFLLYRLTKFITRCNFYNIFNKQMTKLFQKYLQYPCVEYNISWKFFFSASLCILHHQVALFHFIVGTKGFFFYGIYLSFFYGLYLCVRCNECSMRALICYRGHLISWLRGSCQSLSWIPLETFLKLQVVEIILGL